MRISSRILLINFAIVVLILGSSAFAFYSIMYNVLTSQQSKYLLSSANNFIYSYRESLQETEYDFLYVHKEGEGLASSAALTKNLDFILSLSDDGNVKPVNSKEFVQIPESSFNLDEFLAANPFAIIKSYTSDNKTFYFGRILSETFLNEISKKINADIAIVWDNFVSEISNTNSNQIYYHILTQAYNNLYTKNNFEIYTKETDAADILATIYKPSSGVEKTSKLEFIVFSSLKETADLRSNLKYIMVIIGIAGVTLSIILTLLFTGRIRKQITQLSDATEITKDGNFKNKINITTNDEIGHLASAFNKMLEDLEKNERSKREYSEFITLINQNPTLKEISEAALEKIIRTTGFTIGALYLVKNEQLTLTCSYGLKDSHAVEANSTFYDSVIKTKNLLEVNFEQNGPVVSTGLLSFELKYLLLLPIIYNNNVIAILEFGAAGKASEESKEYLSKIKDQLAIGLTNANAVLQLEELISELKQLNEDYQKQNIQIRKQNETLIDLHKKLKEKADELEIQKQKAEESTKVKSQFLASMSHELRTPMNSILGLTELILEEATLKGKNKERLGIVLKSGRRLMTLINDILDLSKIEAGKMEVHEDDVLLDEIIEEVESSISPLVDNKGLKFNIKRNTDTKIIINTDKNKVVQVLINLLGNAIKFTDTGYVELHVSTKNDNGQLIFDVVDSGIGISEEDQKLIFEEFRQVDGTTTRKYSGTGLGLTICQKISEILKGNLSVKSEIGKGSTFTFSFPLNFIRAEETQEGLKVNVETLIKNRRHPVLVIDDDPEVRYTIGQYLSSKGYEVIFAKDGETGLIEAIKSQPFAITLDVMLPNKDGWNILRELKEHPATKNIPVIMISIIGDKNIGYGLGAFEYFVKPISSEKLLSAFGKLEDLAKKKIEKIIIVDDDELEFLKFKHEFKNENVRIDYIQDSELAYHKILESQPDLIILDLMMPKVDGITLSYKLKSNRETKHIPIIISTAKDLSEDEKTSLTKIVEDITVKSKGHPLDVLKIVRDRLRLHENGFKHLKSPEEHFEEAEDDIEENDEVQKETLGEVLIVDDDPDTLFTINEIVQAVGSKTMLAKNGVECLKSLQNKIPDLILLDIMMPEMDGFQAIKKIKENSKWANIPVFAVTAKAMVEDKAIILRHGFDDYVSKPVNSGVLAFKIKKLFTKLNIS